MTYSVVWTADAFQQLTRLVAAEPDPARIRQASDWVDYALRRIPLDVGESRRRGYRLWYGDVLGVYYQVDSNAMTVRVIAVGPARRR
jgi:mRNA-degrading endonuclease RelE of RelBE toxin-antitoxin system